MTDWILCKKCKKAWIQPEERDGFKQQILCCECRGIKLTKSFDHDENHYKS